MILNKQNITKKVLSIFLSFSLLTPNLIEFGHSLVHKNHDICQNESQTHLHDGQDECEILGYHFSQDYNGTNEAPWVFANGITHSFFDSLESQLETVLEVYIYRRGPPHLG